MFAMERWIRVDCLTSVTCKCSLCLFDLASILGGLLVVHAGERGIAYEHIEKVWGDIARADRVLEACSNVSGVSLNASTIAQAQQDHQALHQKMQKSPHAKKANGSSGASTDPTIKTDN